ISLFIAAAKAKLRRLPAADAGPRVKRGIHITMDGGNFKQNGGCQGSVGSEPNPGVRRGPGAGAGYVNAPVTKTHLNGPRHGGCRRVFS
ncbi:MAG: hypothetical protein RLO48_08025, partial [Bauldia litoralis]